VVLLLWIPVLAPIALGVGYGVVRSFNHVWDLGYLPRGFIFSVAWRLMLVTALFVLIAILIRLALQQLQAVREPWYCYLTYTNAVVKLVIGMRKKEVLRSLHLSEANVAFLTEDKTPYYRQGGR